MSASRRGAKTPPESPSAVRRIIRFFDPASPGFLGRMARLVAVAAILTVCPLAAATGLWLRTETGRHFVVYALTHSAMYEESLPRSTALLEDYPGKEWEYYRLHAINLRRLGRHEESLAVYDQAIEDLPNEWWAHSHRCFYTALLTGDPSEVMDSCDRSIELSPEHLPTDRGVAYDRRGFARALIGDREGAIADFEKAASLLGPGEWRGYTTDQQQAREHWLEELRAGRDPLTEEELEMERSHY